MLRCQLWLFRYAPRMAQDPFWRPDGTLDGANGYKQAYAGTGRHKHSVAISQIQRPKFEWHAWSLKADQTFSENMRSAICGGASSGKSYTAGEYAFKWWECAPDISAIIIASTTIDAAKQRIWKSVATAFNEVSRNLGGLGYASLISSPRPMIRSNPEGKTGDFVHGIYVIPVKQGPIEEAIDAIKGRHARRVLIVRDEADAISQAIIDVEANLRVGTEEFQAIDLGNLPSNLNPLGKQMETAPGKPITEALGTEWTSAKGIACVRFDAEQSPNIREKGKWTGLPTQADIDDTIRQHGGTNTRGYYIFVKGLPPPEGVDDTVLSEAMLHAHQAFAEVTWKAGFIMSGSLDPSLGGDKCIFRTFKRGDDIDNQFRTAIDKVIQIPIIVNTPHNPPEYQISTQVKALCLANGIKPDEFIIATTGIGSGVAAALQRDWSPQIQVCHEGGAPSDLPVSEEDPRPAKEVYDKRVSELWGAIREYVQANLLRNLDPTTAIQLCSRKWLEGKKKKTITPKDELSSSPDEADALAFYIELLRRKGISARVQSPAKRNQHLSLEKEAAEQDFDSNNTYAEEEYL